MWVSHVRMSRGHSTARGVRTFCAWKESSPEVGSSAKRRLGEATSSQPIASRFFSPPDSPRTCSTHIHSGLGAQPQNLWVCTRIFQRLCAPHSISARRQCQRLGSWSRRYVGGDPSISYQAAATPGVVGPAKRLRTWRSHHWKRAQEHSFHWMRLNDVQNVDVNNLKRAARRLLLEGETILFVVNTNGTNNSPPVIVYLGLR